METAQQQFIAVWGCTDRSFNETQSQLHFPGRVLCFHPGVCPSSIRWPRIPVWNFWTAGPLATQDTCMANMPTASTRGTHSRANFWKEGIKNHSSALSVHKEHIFTVQKIHCTLPTRYQAPLSSQEIPKKPTVTFSNPRAPNRPSSTGLGEEPTRTRRHLMAGEPPAP